MQNIMKLLGYQIEKSYSESRFPFSNVNPETFLKAQELIKRRYQLKGIIIYQNI